MSRLQTQQLTQKLSKSRIAITSAFGALLFSFAFAPLSPKTVSAQPASGDGDVVIDISGPTRTKYPIAIPVATTGDLGTAKTIQSVAAFDMSVAGWFRVLGATDLPSSVASEGTTLDVDSWKEVGAFGVVKYRSVVSGGRLSITFKLYEIEKGGKPGSRANLQGFEKGRSPVYPSVLQRDGQALHW